MTIQTTGEGFVKGVRKNFEYDFTRLPGANNSLLFEVVPLANKKLRLVQLRYSFGISNTDDSNHWVFEIWAGNDIVNQKWYRDSSQLIAQSNTIPQVVERYDDGNIQKVIYLAFDFPRLSDSDFQVMELLSSKAMKLRIYPTTEDLHQTGQFTEYTKLPVNTAVGLKAGATGVPVAYLVLECVSLDE